MVSGEDVVITEDILGGKCSSTLSDVDIKIESSEAECKSTGSTGYCAEAITKVSVTSSVPANDIPHDVSVGLDAPYESCYIQEGSLQENDSFNDDDISASYGVGTKDAEVKIFSDSWDEGVCGNMRNRKAFRISYPETWTISIGGQEFELDGAGSADIEVEGTTYHISNTGLAVMDYDCPCEGGGRGKIKVTSNLPSNDYLTKVTITYNITESGKSTPVASGSLVATPNNPGSEVHSVFPSTYNITAGTPTFTGDSVSCQVKMTGPDPSSVTVSADAQEEVEINFACTTPCQSSNKFNISVNESIEGGGTLPSQGWSGNTANLPGGSTAKITFSGVPGYKIKSITVNKDGKDPVTVGNTATSYSDIICENWNVDIVYSKDDPCDANNKYSIKVTENYEPWSDSYYGVTNASWGGGGPWYTSNPWLSNVGTGTISGGATQTINFLPPGITSIKVQSYNTQIEIPVSAYVKSVTVNDAAISGTSFSEKICKDTDIVVTYALNGEGTARTCAFMFQNSTASGCESNSSLSTTINIGGSANKSTQFSPGSTPVVEVPCDGSYNFSASLSGYDISFSPASLQPSKNDVVNRDNVNVCLKKKDAGKGSIRIALEHTGPGDNEGGKSDSTVSYSGPKSGSVKVHGGNGPDAAFIDDLPAGEYILSATLNSIAHAICGIPVGDNCQAIPVMSPGKVTVPANGEANTTLYINCTCDVSPLAHNVIVQHYEDGTNKKIAEDVDLGFKFSGESVTHSCQKIDGYTSVDTSIMAEVKDSDLILSCYYKKQDACQTGTVQVFFLFNGNAIDEDANYNYSVTLTNKEDSSLKYSDSGSGDALGNGFELEGVCAGSYSVSASVTHGGGVCSNGDSNFSISYGNSATVTANNTTQVNVDLTCGDMKFYTVTTNYKAGSTVLQSATTESVLEYNSYTFNCPDTLTYNNATYKLSKTPTTLYNISSDKAGTCEYEKEETAAQDCKVNFKWGKIPDGGVSGTITISGGSGPGVTSYTFNSSIASDFTSGNLACGETYSFSGSVNSPGYTISLYTVPEYATSYTFGKTTSTKPVYFDVDGDESERQLPGTLTVNVSYGSGVSCGPTFTHEIIVSGQSDGTSSSGGYTYLDERCGGSYTFSNMYPGTYYVTNTPFYSSSHEEAGAEICDGGVPYTDNTSGYVEVGAGQNATWTMTIYCN